MLSLPGGRQSVELFPGWRCVPHQIGQAIEEVNSNNQELLRKYRRELQLRKKCHNELVRLKGDYWVGGGGWCLAQGSSTWFGGGPALPLDPQHHPMSCALSSRSYCHSLFEDKAAESQRSQGLDPSSSEALAPCPQQATPRLRVATGSGIETEWGVSGMPPVLT